jgi:hypothetical protein
MGREEEQMIERPRTPWATAAFCLLLTACAHSGFDVPDDPADETAARFADLVRPHPDALCTALEIEIRRSFVANQGTTVSVIQRRAVGTSVSQASEAIAGEYAMSQVTPTPGDAQMRARVSQARLVADAQFAAAWTALFGTPEGSDDYGMLLDGLTTWSMHDLDALRAYHDEFRTSRDDGCD